MLSSPNIGNKMDKIILNNNFINCDISLIGKPYIINDILNEKLECLNKTNLFRIKKNNNTLLQTWNNSCKNLNYANIEITPNYLQILKESEFTNLLNYQLGGMCGGKNDIEINKKFINTENKEIEIQYSYQVVNLLKKALNRLNSNNIYLDENEIKNINEKIEILNKSEIELSNYAKNIIDVIKINNNFNNKNILFNSQTLEKYIKEHKILSYKSNNIANNLNTTFIKIIELFDEKN